MCLKMESGDAKYHKIYCAMSLLFILMEFCLAYKEI